MKKLMCAVLALALCMGFVLAGCGPEDDTPGSVSDNKSDGNTTNIVQNENTDTRSDIVIEELESVTQTTPGAEAELFTKGVYYLEGIIYSDEGKIPIQIATDITNMQFTMSLSKKLGFGVLLLGDDTYAVLPSSKVYTEFSNNLLKYLGSGDSINVSEFQVIKNEGENGQMNMTQTAVTINGEPGLCTNYIYDDMYLKLYSIGDKLVQVETYEANGTLSMQIVVNSITAQIPADQLTLKGFTQVSLPVFLSSMVTG